jgi:hypothetical protein
MTRSKQLAIGDRVAYSRSWLRSIGAYTGDLPHAKGTITGLKTLSREITLADVAWEGNPDIPGRVNVRNLCRIGGIDYSG